ncbi:uncharacterized protein LOC112683797 [Sipha flava]|uniref:Uncharacterized protein LOC112683797 n=1 Tax=Sipha flava TaxID=143950 RepID=A0A8B8FJ86_9HEMI|nr:uncharacterized protein LOC112683797 [Sipha flava]
MGLPLLNPEEVRDCFMTDLMSVSPDDERHQEITSERTNNSCESFHSKLNSQFTKGHPNIFIFTHILNQKNTY